MHKKMKNGDLKLHTKKDRVNINIIPKFGVSNQTAIDLQQFKNVTISPNNHELFVNFSLVLNLLLWSQIKPNFETLQISMLLFCQS